MNNTSIHFHIVAEDVRKLSRTQWLELRRQSLGGSDISAALGLNRWRSPMEVWAEKVGLPLPRQETPEACRWGILLEEVVRAELAERTGWTIQKPVAMYRHRTIPFLSANVDGLAQIPEKGLAVVEIKTASSYKEGEWSGGQVPPEYYLQGQHYLSVLDLRHCVFACLIGGQKLVIAEMERDDDMIRDIHRLATAFWNRVVAKTPPDPDGSEATAAFLSKLFPLSENAVPLILPEKADELVSNWLGAKNEEDLAADRRRLAENELKLLMQDHERAVTPKGQVISWKTVTTSRLDSARLKKEQPAMLEQYTTTASSRRFAVSGKQVQ